MEIKKIHQEFSVCQVEDYSFVNLDSEYSFIGKTDEEKSLVCLTSEVPPNVIRCDDGWKALRIQGVLEFSLIGILSKIAAILADHNPILHKPLCVDDQKLVHSIPHQSGEPPLDELHREFQCSQQDAEIPHRLVPERDDS